MKKLFAFSIVPVLCVMPLLSCLPTGPTSSHATTPPVSANTTVQVSLANTSAYFEVGKCYVGRTSSSSAWVYWMMQVINRSSLTLPFVRISGIRFRDDYGDLISTDTSMDYTYVAGRVMVVGFASLFTNTCLAPGDTGYFLSIDTVTTKLASITADSISCSSSSISPPAAAISATSYTYQNNALDISVYNSGTVGAKLLDGCSLLLGSSGVPVLWTLVSPVDSMISAGGRGVYEESYLSFSGSFQGVKLFSDFEDAAFLAKRSAKSPRIAPGNRMTDEMARVLINERNRRESAKSEHKK
jgi:hypothetical protein